MCFLTGTTMKIAVVVTISCFTAFSVSAGTPPFNNASSDTDEVNPPHSVVPYQPEPSTATFTTFQSEEKRKQGEVNLTETTVVILVSGSLALIVCAVIPLIFYRHWQTNADHSRLTGNTDEGSHYEDYAEDSIHATVGLQSLQEVLPESSGEDNHQYATVYEGLDPKSLE
ncbi:hypothetical protein OJAV_G00000250 [Oryzias javanicus]|uniref:Uncharacterized protein n=1 Tax=Oryzias javanicus TaxID=123683 RepID=A0A437DM34_ORYJA|nr:hypothetical protein OJAV_G00000250 [Oryzias javanicus]